MCEVKAERPYQTGGTVARVERLGGSEIGVCGSGSEVCSMVGSEIEVVLLKSFSGLAFLLSVCSGRDISGSKAGVR